MPALYCRFVVNLYPAMEFLAKLFVVVTLITILVSLGSGLIFLIRDRGTTTRTVKALTVRIALSVTLFILLLIAGATGLITPHGVFSG